ncbi:MAG: hypothetical protein R2911_32100 [Caldilineaceae bacterium]
MDLTSRDWGILLLDPADADTDNDKLADGLEVNPPLEDSNRWVVRLADKEPYQVYSHPLRADADLDQLVDGDEQWCGTDPGVANTDSDARDDYQEAYEGLNPLQRDFKVTVTFISFKTLSKGSGAGPGDPEFKFQVGVPDSKQESGVAPKDVVSNDDQRNKLRQCTEDKGFNTNPTPCWDDATGDYYLGLQMRENEQIPIDPTQNLGSFNFQYDG